MVQHDVLVAIAEQLRLIPEQMSEARRERKSNSAGEAATVAGELLVQAIEAGAFRDDPGLLLTVRHAMSTEPDGIRYGRAWCRAAKRILDRPNGAAIELVADGCPVIADRLLGEQSNNAAAASTEQVADADDPGQVSALYSELPNDPFWAALQRIIDAMEREDESKPTLRARLGDPQVPDRRDYVNDLAIESGLSRRPIFAVWEERDNEGNVWRSRLVVQHPGSSDPLNIIVWTKASARKAPRFNPAKVRSLVSYLRAWQVKREQQLRGSLFITEAAIEGKPAADEIGWTYSQFADFIGCDHTTVKRWGMAVGISPRGSGNAPYTMQETLCILEYAKRNARKHEHKRKAETALVQLNA